MEELINNLSEYMNELIKLTNDNKIVWSKTMISRGNKTYTTNVGYITIELRSNGSGKSFKITDGNSNTISISGNEYNISADLAKLIEAVDQRYMYNRLSGVNDMLKRVIETTYEKYKEE